MFTLAHLPQHSNPQGKERVYYTAHPADHEGYLQAVAEDIFKTHTCAVYYRPDPVLPVPAEAQRELLGSMQLFVIPITSRFLQDPSPALEADFRFAVENHIPVLPLMQESGLEEAFNRVCGDLQFLDKHTTDPTAISYDKKLKDFLDSVLLGDELTEKVRNSFDAYIFLSYRKKDRRYAQELMRQIHKNEFCRDIAIWYDEYLIPGENFNHSIQDAMKKSRLFTMVVTPSLLEQPNYILDHEYVDAQKLCLPILPAQMVSTDSAVLQQLYANIPSTVDGRYAPALTHALQDHLAGIARVKEEADPLHDYHIGLAYLGGIDVEVDHDRALQLITAAAHAQLPQAMEKLIAMYRNGEGVPRDHRTAIDWMEKLALCLQKQYEACPDAEKLERLLWAYCHIGDAWREYGSMEPALEAYRRMEQQLDNRVLSNMEPVCTGRIMDIFLLQMELEQARIYAERTVAGLKQLSENTEELLYREAYLVACCKLGDIARSAQDYSAAKQVYLQALTGLQALQSSHAERDLRSQINLVLVRLGDLAAFENDHAAAREYYEKTLLPRQQLADEFRTVAARRELAITYERCAAACIQTEDPEAAHTYLLKAEEIDRQLLEQTDSLQARRDLGLLYGTFSHLSHLCDNLPSARDFCTRAMEIMETVTARTNLTEDKQNLSACYFNLGVLEARLQEPQTAYDHLVACLQLRDALYREDPKPRQADGLACTCHQIGILLEEYNNDPDAENYLLKAVSLWKTLDSKTLPKKTVRAMGDCYFRICRIHEEKDTKRAFSACVRAVECLLPLLEKGDEQDLHRLAEFFQKLGELAEQREDLAACFRYHENAYKLRRDLFGKTGDPAHCNDIITSLLNMGNACGMQQKEEAALQYYRQAYTLANSLVKQVPRPDSCHSLALCLYSIGQLQQDAQCLQDAIRLWQILEAEDPDYHQYIEIAAYILSQLS